MFSGFEMSNSFAGFAVQTPPDGCTQCGICLSTCPTYAKSEDPEQSPMGRIRLMRALEEGSHEGMAVEKLEGCLGCYSCETICPSKVNYGKMLDESLARLREQRPLPVVTRIMLYLADRRTTLKILLRITWLTQVTGLRGVMQRLGLLKVMGIQRLNRLLGRINYPARQHSSVKHIGSKQRVALFTGCFSSEIERCVQQASIEILHALGVEVILSDDEVCCGALHRHTGDLETAAKLARNNIKAFSAEKVDAIVTTSSGCGAGLKAYDQWLDDDGLPYPVMDISQFIIDAMRRQRLVFKHLPLKVALHTPCTMRHSGDQEIAVMGLLQKIPGLEINTLSGEPRCCGAGGTQMLTQPEMADALRDDLVAEIKATGADVVISSNMGCAIHLRHGLTQAGMNVPLLHPVQLISQTLMASVINAVKKPV